MTASTETYVCQGCAALIPAGDECPDCIPCECCWWACPEGEACPNCFECCGCCELHSNCASYTDEYGTEYCEHCFYELYSNCSFCDLLVSNNYTCLTDSGDTVCQSCYADSETELDSYNAQVPLTPLRPDLPGTLVGFELEVEAVHTDLSSLISVAREYFDPYGILVEDGSLSNGFEIVTRRAPLSFWTHRAEEVWNGVNALRRAGGRSYSTTTCGLHVSQDVGKRSALTLYKLLTLLRKEEQGLTMFLSSRSSVEALREWSNPECGGRSVRIFSAKTKETSKYQAFRLEGDRGEMRIFRGTLDTKAIKAKLEAAVCLADFAEAASLRDLTGLAFSRFLRANRSRYSYLSKWVKARNTNGYLFSF